MDYQKLYEGACEDIKRLTNEKNELEAANAALTVELNYEVGIRSQYEHMIDMQEDDNANDSVIDVKNLWKKHEHDEVVEEYAMAHADTPCPICGNLPCHCELGGE